MNYLVCEINKKQYLVKPGQSFEIDKIAETKSLVVDKVLLIASDDKVEIGTPYLDTKLTLEILGNINKPKVRVATYTAKSNRRRVIGEKRSVTKVQLAQSKEVKK
ncbi:MAG: 50S ribosomal protein L21 [Candidatus Daviesbacteria bacterium]|nr:50S ribosomal protein L21 [Candidatus Daviesbacteria bacterium]